MKHSRFVIALALVLSAMFGAADQYLGSFSMYPWMTDVSLLSAPWLILPFLAGVTQRNAKRAAFLGLGCTLAALIGYGVMTLSPVENVHPTMGAVLAFIRSERRVILGGLVTGPLFGWLGHRWRFNTSWAAGAVTAAMPCLEPLARASVHLPIGTAAVLWCEIAVGALSLAYIGGRVLFTSRHSA
jgi:ABC-type transport system involved in multi-copper enzyme maturation permease subunit